MLLVFGLGNPGREYKNTYHNAGRMALQALQDLLEEKGQTGRLKAQAPYFWYRKFAGAVLAGASSDLYMNQSGRAVGAALGFFKLGPEDLVLLHDDSDLVLGDWKLEKGRGAAGHHGVESVIQALDTKDFWRGRIGIRPPEPAGPPPGRKRRKADEFVLSPVNAADRKVLEAACQRLAEKVTEKV